MASAWFRSIEFFPNACSAARIIVISDEVGCDESAGGSGSLLPDSGSELSGKSDEASAPAAPELVSGTDVLPVISPMFAPVRANHAHSATVSTVTNNINSRIVR
jgi:hypothetical protein